MCIRDSTSTLGALVGHNDNGGVLIKTDVGTVVAAHAMLAAHDDSLDAVSYTHLPDGQVAMSATYFISCGTKSAKRAD